MSMLAGTFLIDAVEIFSSQWVNGLRICQKSYGNATLHNTASFKSAIFIFRIFTSIFYWIQQMKRTGM